MLRTSFIIFLALTAWIHPALAVSAFAETPQENPTFINYEKFHTAAVQEATPSSRSVVKKTEIKKTYSNEANGDIQTKMKTKIIAKWGESEWAGMHYILDHESGSNPYAINKKSGACGIPQALPCSKLLKVIGSLDNVDGQLDWMISYVQNRYQTPTKAMAFHQIHNWY